MVHDRSGQVVGDGFSRAEPPRLLPHPGYSYRLTRLLGGPAAERVSCSPMPAA